MQLILTISVLFISANSISAPDCYHCDGENCGPAFGLACYPPGTAATSVFQRMDTCVKWCGKVEITECVLPNEVYDDCGSECAATCDNRGKVECNSECIPGCYCLDKTFRNLNTGECVQLENCPRTNKTFYCEKFATVLCLLSLAEIPNKLPGLNIQSLQKLALKENEEKLNEICDMFAEYESCANEEAEKNQCVINGPMDRLAQTSGQLMCDPKMTELIRKNSDCLGKLDGNVEYKKCSDKFGVVINLENIDEFVSGESDKVCEIVMGHTEFEPCAEKVVADVCEPSAMEMMDYFRDRVEEFRVKNDCNKLGAVVDVAAEPEPSVVAVVNANPSAHDPNMFTTTGCSEAETDKVEDCFVPLYGLKNQSLGIFGKGVHLLKDNIENVIVWSCEKFESGTKPCLLEMQENTESCKVYSCLLHSVRTGCSDRKNLDKHWGCLFKMITHDKVIGCLGGLLAQNREATDWTVVIPELIECVDEPVREGCGDKTMNFLATLSVNIASPADNGGCEVNRNFLDAYTVKSAELDELSTVPGEQETTTEGTIAYTANPRQGQSADAAKACKLACFDTVRQSLATGRQPTPHSASEEAKYRDKKYCEVYGELKTCLKACNHGAQVLDLINHDLNGLNHSLGGLLPHCGQDVGSAPEEVQIIGAPEEVQIISAPEEVQIIGAPEEELIHQCHYGGCSPCAALSNGECNPDFNIYPNKDVCKKAGCGTKQGHWWHIYDYCRQDGSRLRFSGLNHVRKADCYPHVNETQWCAPDFVCFPLEVYGLYFCCPDTPEQFQIGCIQKCEAVVASRRDAVMSLIYQPNALLEQACLTYNDNKECVLKCPMGEAGWAKYEEKQLEQDEGIYRLLKSSCGSSETKIDTNPVKVTTSTAETSPQVAEYCRKVLNENKGDTAFCSFKNFKETCKNVCPQ